MSESIPDHKMCCTFESRQTISLRGDEEERVEGKILICWPYDISQEIDLDLVGTVAGALQTWQGSHLTRVYPQMKHCIKVSAGLAVGFLGQDGMDVQKITSMGKFLLFNYFFDDQLEMLANRDDYPRIIYHATKSLALVEGNHFQDITQLEADPSFQRVQKVDGGIGDALILLFHWSKELYGEFGKTPEEARHFRLQHRHMYEVLSWCGSKKFSHLRNPVCFEQNRVKTGGGCPTLELIFLLRGIQLSRKVRENMYWERLLLRGATINLYLNEFFSFEREWEEAKEMGNCLDNAVYVQLQAGRSLKEALAHVGVLHDQSLMEFRAIVTFLQKNPRYATEEEGEEREHFFASIHAMAKAMAKALQIYKLARYGQFKFRMEQAEDVRDVFEGVCDKEVPL